MKMLLHPTSVPVRHGLLVNGEPAMWKTPRRRLDKCLYVVSVVVTLLAGMTTASNAHEAPYRGQPLQPVPGLGGLVTFTCRAHLVNRAGYYHQPDGWLQELASETEPKEARWIITMNQDWARVADGQGNVGLYRITKHEVGGPRVGLLFVEAEKGASIQVITIDPGTSSFVYTTQNAHSLWNRATTFVGRCE